MKVERVICDSKNESFYLDVVDVMNENYEFYENGLMDKVVKERWREWLISVVKSFPR